MCIINNQGCKEYLIDIVKNNKLLPLFLSGKISIYFLAAIPNFKQIILKFDKVTQEEFKHLYDNFERYNSEINEACLVVRNIKANPIKNVNSFLFQMSSSLS